MIDFKALEMACEHAGQEVLLIVQSGSNSVQDKSDGSPLSRADLCAHQIMMQALAQYGGGLPVISEEGDLSQDPGDDFWLLDPIDGTKDLIQGLPEYGVNLALIRDGLVVWGCIAAPALGVVYVGDVKAQKCSRREISTSLVEDLHLDASRLHPRHRPGPKILLSINHPDAQTTALLSEIPGYKPMQVGSSLKFCALAENRADWYPRKIGLSQWDMAAGHGILKAAGGNAAGSV